MHAFDYEAVVYEGEIYCTGCLPEGVSVESDEVSPIFADSEWDYYPICSVCGETHTYMNLTAEGRKFEHLDDEETVECEGCGKRMKPGKGAESDICGHCLTDDSRVKG